MHTTGAGSEGVLLRREGQSQGENALNALHIMGTAERVHRFNLLSRLYH